MIDFEKPLQNAIKKNFPKAQVDGCYFHFVKLLWTKAKTLGLTTKNRLKITKILIFILKLIPFIDIDNRKLYLINVINVQKNAKIALIFLNVDNVI